MAVLLYQGHGSFRITADNGTVLYFDPYAGEGYDTPADLILVTHDHHDHNRVDLVPQRPGCRVITWKEALEGGTYHTFAEKGITMEAVPAANRNHDPACCVGFVLTVDGKVIYAAGDTSATEAMGSRIRDLKPDWALLPTDGVYNMGPEEASRCAETVGAKHSVPIHMKPGALFSREAAERFTGPNRVIVEPGEVIRL